MPKPGKTHITILLDRSGSMSATADDAIGGFNHLLEVQKAEPGECTFTLIQFDHEYQIRHFMEPISDIQPLTSRTFEPRGSTAYVDALARSIIETGKALEAIPDPERPFTVIFAVITDGMENASVEHRGPDGRAAVARMVDHQRDTYGWQFAFMGSNQDAIQTGGELHIPAASALTYGNDQEQIKGAFDSLARGISRSRAGGASGQCVAMSFTDEDRKKQEGIKTK